MFLEGPEHSNARISYYDFIFHLRYPSSTAIPQSTRKYEKQKHYSIFFKKQNQKNMQASERVERRKEERKGKRANEQKVGFHTYANKEAHIHVRAVPGCMLNPLSYVLHSNVLKCFLAHFIFYMSLSFHGQLQRHRVPSCLKRSLMLRILPGQVRSR